MVQYKSTKQNTTKKGNKKMRKLETITKEIRNNIEKGEKSGKRIVELIHEGKTNYDALTKEEKTEYGNVQTVLKEEFGYSQTFISKACSVASRFLENEFFKDFKLSILFEITAVDDETLTSMLDNNDLRADMTQKEVREMVKRYKNALTGTVEEVEETDTETDTETEETETEETDTETEVKNKISKRFNKLSVKNVDEFLLEIENLLNDEYMMKKVKLTFTIE